MKVLLISGSVSGEKRYGKLKSVGSYMPPYGLLSIAGLLEKDGHTAQILDREIYPFSEEQIANRITCTKPDLIGMSVYTIGFKEAIKTATFLKRHFDTPIVAGGPHTFVDFDNFSKNECFDFFVIGEGEITMSDLVKALEGKGDLWSVAGLAARMDGNLIKNPPRERLKNLDILPFPAFHLLENIIAYHPSPLGYRKRPFFPLVTSRGCPFHCYFCSPIWGHKWVAHSADYVVNLMEYLIKEFNAKEIWFSEDTFVIDKQRVIDICQGILRRNLEISWTCMANVHKLDREMLSMMKKAGCWQMQLGLESGNDEVLQFIGKKTSVQMIREKVNLIHEVGIQARGYFILDHLIETRETMRETINFAMSLPLYSADFHLLQLPFGSRAREIAHKYGKVDYNPDLLTGYSSQGLGFVPKGMTEGFLFRTQRKAHLKFFLRPKQILQMIMSIRTLEDMRRYVQMFWAGVKTLL
jgi:anaerobic magnesium-protoporphyrin IX monomethyl ester cyclase